MVAPSSRAARRRGGAGDGGGTIVAGRSDDRGGRRTPCARSRITARPALLQSGSAFGGTSDGSAEAPVEGRSEEHTSELQSHSDLVCRLLLEKKKIYTGRKYIAT